MASKKKVTKKAPDPLRMDVDSQERSKVVITVYTVDGSNVKNGQLTRALRQAIEVLHGYGDDNGQN